MRLQVKTFPQKVKAPFYGCEIPVLNVLVSFLREFDPLIIQGWVSYAESKI